jgi:hypothetical protein
MTNTLQRLRVPNPWLNKSCSILMMFFGRGMQRELGGGQTHILAVAIFVRPGRLN